MRRHRMAAALAATLTAPVLLVGCSSSGSDEVVRMWIEPELVECVGVAPMECMQVAYKEDGETQLFYDSIDGFTFEPGTSYVLDVRVDEVEDPPADASSLTYTLVEVVSAEPS